VRKSLKQPQKWQVAQKIQWRVIPTEIGRSASYVDPPKHCYVAGATGVND